MATTSERLRSLLLYPLPHHALSALVNRATRWKWRAWKDFLITRFCAAYDVNLDEAMHSRAADYADFNSFFTRALAPGARPLAPDPSTILSPVDGRVSAAGPLEGERVLQAKGMDYSLRSLLGDAGDVAARFEGGSFATLYLSPRDYHRIHMPMPGTLRETIHVPGRLFSVAPWTVNSVPGLFARNERLVCLFEHDDMPFALVLVGAIFVSSMQTTWAGLLPPRPDGKPLRQAPPGPVSLERGAEMGRFNMGSTVILLLPPGAARWLPGIESGEPVHMGQALAQHLDTDSR